MQAVPRIDLRGLTKSFDGTVVLHGVDLTVLPGEVHGLIGENGSGKSTLIKVLAGYHEPDAGVLHVDGEQVALPPTAGALRQGKVAFVHQDLGLIESLSVVDNYLLPERSSGPWMLDNRAERAHVAEIMARYGVDLDVSRTVGELRPVERAQVAIVRAIESILRRDDRGGLLVLDEPTVFLPKHEVEQLFDLVQRVVERDASVLFVSHDIEEVETITDRLTVLRDGHRIATVETNTLGTGELLELIVGHPVDTSAGVRGQSDGAPVRAVVRDLSGGSLDDLSLTVHEGEILGLAGLIGSGADELPYLLFGATPVRDGTFELDGHLVDLSALTPGEAMRRGMGLIPADRKNRGSIGSLPVDDNIAMTVLDDFVRRGMLDRRGLRSRSKQLVEEFDVRPPAPDRTFSTLSGGNQQKVALAKWFQRHPTLLLLHEPTQGVDVGAREQVYDLLRELAGRGTSIICSSTDSAELANLCDRVLAFNRGSVTSELVGGELTKDRISRACLAGPANGQIDHESETAHG